MRDVFNRYTAEVYPSRTRTAALPAGTGRIRLIDPEHTVVLGKLAGTEFAVHHGLPAAMVLIALVLSGFVFPTMFPGWDSVSYLVAGALAAVAEGGAGLLHEVGHASVARLHGRRVYRVTFYGFAAATWRNGGQAPPLEQVLTALAGPSVHFALAGLFIAIRLAVGPGALPLYAVLGFAVLTNVLLGLINLLPLRPLDGARAWHGAIRVLAERRSR